MVLQETMCLSGVLGRASPRFVFPEVACLWEGETEVEIDVSARYGCRKVALSMRQSLQAG